MTPPRLSVAVCTFNGERFIEEQLDSIASQTRLPDELVVCDDGSTDRTVRIVRAFAEHVNFPVDIHVNASNVGAAANFEQAISRCTGDLIALCDQDDVWLPQRLERAYEVLSEEPEIGFTFSDAMLVDERNRDLGRGLWDAVGFTPHMRAQAAGEGLLSVLVRQNVVAGATMTFRSSVKRIALPLAESWWHDAWLSLTVSFFFRARACPEQLVRYRIHAAQLVGAPPGLGVRGYRLRTPAWAEARRLSRTADYRDRRRGRAEALPLVAERVRQIAAGGLALVDGSAQRRLAELDARARHELVRVTLPRRRRERSRPVLEELRSGRYSRFSRGLMSAVKDLIA